MNIFKKIFGIRYRVGDKFFLSEKEAIKCADQDNETCKTEWFKHDKETYDDTFRHWLSGMDSIVAVYIGILVLIVLITPLCRLKYS